MTDKPKNWYVYMIRDSYDRLYTGITTDVNKRLLAHKAGKGAKFLRGMSSIQLVYCSCPLDKIQAAQYEHKIKKLNKKTKEQIINQKTDITQFFI